MLFQFVQYFLLMKVLITLLHESLEHLLDLCFFLISSVWHFMIFFFCLRYSSFFNSRERISTIQVFSPFYLCLSLCLGFPFNSNFYPPFLLDFPLVILYFERFLQSGFPNNKIFSQLTSFY